MQHHEEWLASLVLFQPLQREVGDEIRVVALGRIGSLWIPARVFDAVGGRDKDRIVILPLTWPDLPIIEAPGSGLQMPLPEEYGLIAGALKNCRHIWCA